MKNTFWKRNILNTKYYTSGSGFINWCILKFRIWKMHQKHGKYILPAYCLNPFDEREMTKDRYMNFDVTQDDRELSLLISKPGGYIQNDILGIRPFICKTKKLDTNC